MPISKAILVILLALFVLTIFVIIAWKMFEVSMPILDTVKDKLIWAVKSIWDVSSILEWSE